MDADMPRRPPPVACFLAIVYDILFGAIASVLTGLIGAALGRLIFNSPRRASNRPPGGD